MFRLPVFRIGILFALCALLLGPALAIEIAPEDVPALAIPRMTAPPTIDGAINPAEWREALAISGVANQRDDHLLSPRPTTFFLGWDAGHLYLAYRIYMRSNYKPYIRNGRSYGQAWVFDDGAELIIKPMGKNIPVNNQHASFRFFLNCIGVIGDMSRLDLGQQIKNWLPVFKTAYRMTAPGTAPNGGSWCEVEMSASLADFELTGDNRAGDGWRMMLGFNHVPIWMQARIPNIGSYYESDCDGYCHLTLVDNTPAVQFTMDSLSNLASDGTATVQIKAYNPTQKTINLNVDINVAGKIVKHEMLALPAGGDAQYSLNEKLPADVTEGKASLRVSQGTRPLLTYAVPFKVGGMNWMMAPVQASNPKDFAFSTQFNPVRDWLLVKGDTYYLPNPKSARSLHYRVLADGEMKPITEGTLTRIADWYFQQRLDLPHLKSGKYTIEASMLLDDGRTLGPMKASFEKKDEAMAFPDWWGKNYGNVERVLPPFTAMTRKGNAVTCWEREYALNTLGLPAAIQSHGGAVLAAPARIVIAAGGKETIVPLNGSPTFTSTKDWRVSFTGKTRGGGLDFTTTGWAEQDGLVYVELTFAPSGKIPANIDALRIEYPISAKEAQCLLCIGPGANFSSKTNILLPPDKQGRLWSTLDTGRAGSGMAVGTFYPTVWIGNDQRGLVWWGDNDKGWFPEDDTAAHDAVRDGAAVVLRNNIISKPVLLTEARTITFSYLATPFRPFTKAWRMEGCTEDGTFVGPHRSPRKDPRTGNMINAHGHQTNWICPASPYPDEWAALWAEQKAKTIREAANQWNDPYAARNGVAWDHMSFTLHGYGHYSTEDQLYNYFGAEWEGETWNASMTDYVTYLLNRAFHEGGVRSTYWDITFPTQHENLLSGLCYQLPDGRIQRGYDGWNVRRFYMRAQALTVDNGLFPNAIGSHSTNAYIPIAMPWLDAVLDGERNWNLDMSDMDWVDYYPIERMRAMSSPHSWGTPICWMANMDTTIPAKRDAAKRIQAQWVWMHDSWRNTYIPQLPVMPAPILDWGINSEQTVYHPYWRNPYVACVDKDILVSLWQLPDRILLGVFNYNRKQRKDVTLTIDLDKLNLAPQLPWQEFVRIRDLWKADEKTPDSSLDFNHRTLSVKALEPHTARFIGIRRY